MAVWEVGLQAYHAHLAVVGRNTVCGLNLPGGLTATVAVAENRGLQPCGACFDR